MKNSIKNREDIDNIFKFGKSITEGIICAKFLESSETKFLFAVSSSKFKRAVDRNRIKRLMRESVRGIKVCNKSIAFIFIGNGVPDFEIVKNSIDKIANRI